MTIRYVDGANGNDAWDGLAPNFVSGTNGPKATWNGAEDTPVVAGDLVHVRSGTYRELLTVDVSGTAGNAIEYRGDHAGVIWPGGGPVRITGSDNDQTATRANCISANAKNYRVFTGFVMDMCTGSLISLVTAASDNWIIQYCVFGQSNAGHNLNIYIGSTNFTIQNCVFTGTHAQYNNITFNKATTLDNAGHLVQNCLFIGSTAKCISTDRVGGITVKNCTFMGRPNPAIEVTTALTVGQTLTVNNCIFVGNFVAVKATVTGELVENYNTFYGCNTDRTNINTGANSVTYPPLFDPRWLLELASGKGRLLLPFDLASYSQLVNLAGTSPATTDMRGTAVIGAQREWGALEYDPALLYRRVIARQA